jgi:hypothetical protein
MDLATPHLGLLFWTLLTSVCLILVVILIVRLIKVNEIVFTYF